VISNASRDKTERRLTRTTVQFNLQSPVSSRREELRGGWNPPASKKQSAKPTQRSHVTDHPRGRENFQHLSPGMSIRFFPALSPESFLPTSMSPIDASLSLSLSGGRRLAATSSISHQAHEEAPRTRRFRDETTSLRNAPPAQERSLFVSLSLLRGAVQPPCTDATFNNRALADIPGSLLLIPPQK